MPAKKKKTDTVEQVPEEAPETQEEAFVRLSNNLTSTFEKGFEKWQQALINMATPAPVAAPIAQPEKRTAEEQIQGPNTRNKALRPVYNPETKKGKETTTAKGKAKCNRAQPQRQADAIDVEQQDVMPLGTTSGSHLAFANVNNPESAESKDYAMNQWLINEAPKYKGAFSFNDLPTSAAAIPNDPQLEAQVQNVLINTASTLAKGNSQSGVFPHNYVRRGFEKKRMGLNSLTAIEYIGGIFKII